MKPEEARRLGVCSWSLRASGAKELVERVRACGVNAVQLHLDPLREGKDGWGEIETVNRLRGAGISVLSGMMGMAGEDYTTLETIKATGGVRPDATWGVNRAAAEGNAALAQRLGIGLVTFHAGFIPHERGSKERGVMIGRLREIVDVFASRGVRVGFETGQESADTLVEALEELDRAHAGVNFDPANMILYGMGDPVKALAQLGPRVVQVHVKDAVATKTPGTWGEEVRAGTGGVAWKSFFSTLREVAPGVDLLIEREAGEDRVGDVRAARELVAGLVGGVAGASGQNGVGA